MGKIETTTTSVSSNTHTSAIQRRNLKMKWMHVEYTSDATVGNRQIRVELLNAAGTHVYDARAGTTQAASLVRDYAFMWGTFRETSFVDGQIHVPFPQEIIVPANYTFKVYDQADISSSDSFVLSYQTEEI